MTFGEPGAEGTRISDLKEIEKIFDIFQGHGHSEASSSDIRIVPLLIFNIPVKVDTAFFYSALTSEKVLGKTDWKARGLKMETKLFPSFVRLSLPSGCRTPLTSEVYT